MEHRVFARPTWNNNVAGPKSQHGYYIAIIRGPFPPWFPPGNSVKLFPKNPYYSETPSWIAYTSEEAQQFMNAGRDVRNYNERATILDYIFSFDGDVHNSIELLNWGTSKGDER